MNTVKLLGVKITSEKKDKVLEYLLNRLKTSREKTFIVTPNPEMLVYASEHLDYKNKLNSSTIALPDGIGIFFAGSVMGKPLKERITGVDFIEDLCAASKNQPLSIGFLGGKEGVAKRTAECLQLSYPWIDVIFAAEEWPSDGILKIKDLGLKNKKEKEFKSSIINHKSIDILFVAFGVPKQEDWIFKNLEKLPVKAMMGVGGAFDFISGNVPRAPFVLRYVGLEWLFRLIVQPWRWQRQLALIEFIFLVFKERFSDTS